MTKFFGVVLCGLMGIAMALTRSRAEAKDDRVFEMRTYYAAPGKLDALHARFRDHTVKLFEKHGMTNVGYWVPIDNPDSKLIYILAYPNNEAREKSWKGFREDPEWVKAKSASEVNGTLVSKVEPLFLTATDYSPKIEASEGGDRVFELRTYTASPGNLERLNSRFRDHTVKLFSKHGMTNVAYWNLAANQKQADAMLIYILSHKSADAAKTSFGSFGKDPDWAAARTASEKAGGGSLTAKDGVKSVFLKATDYSPIK